MTMTQMYQEMIESQIGTGRALKRVQDKMRNGGEPIENWAAFGIVGHD